MAAMLRDTTEYARDYLTRAIPILTENLHYLRSTEPQSGLPTLGDSTDGLAWILEFLNNASLALPESEASLAEEIKENVENLTNAIHLIVDAMKSSNYFLLGDVIEFELLETLKTTQAHIDRILQINR